MRGYAPTIMWAGPVRHVTANCRDCPWGTDVKATVLSRKHLHANPTHHVIVEAVVITILSALSAPESVANAS